mmetsp:Transcript_44201/g.44750  ORF Transcript_44201/g.44750 Transcript_44201/m.44750 type:complete len:109 (-) Transcript_44201:452-778(-)
METRPGQTMIKSFEQFVNKVHNTAHGHARKFAQESLDETNSIKAMVTTGSKGSFIEISHIIACVGHQTCPISQRMIWDPRARGLSRIHTCKDYPHRNSSSTPWVDGKG